MIPWLRILLLSLSCIVSSYALEYSESRPIDANASEWDGFRYEDLGLTQWEFQQVRESGMARETLMELLELGIRPSEYLQKPWESLGVSEQNWLSERGKGMEDSDIDRSYRNRNANQSSVYLSLLLPSLYQWKSDKDALAISMNAIWGLSVAFYAALAVSTKTSDETYLLPFILGVHVWSFADALLDTRWENNPDANRFSWGIAPTPHGGWVSAMGFRF